jgi:hypothetical protein
MHAVAKVLMDEPAAGSLKKREYYRYVWENKPTWQRV